MTSMFKRTDKDASSHSATPAKRAKLDIPQKNTHFGSKSVKRSIYTEDVWGDDFAEEDMEEIDFIASQACLQEGIEESKTQSSSHNVKQDNITASSSKEVMYSNINNVMGGLSQNTKLLVSAQKLTCSLDRGTQGEDYGQFAKSLLNRNNHNSTFRLSNNSQKQDLETELNKLKSEKEKLLNDFITKDGETVFLRHQLQQTQARIENEKLEKAKFIEEQANRHRTEINQICKEKEDLKTRLELQTLEVEKLLERCKLLESGNVKLIEPQTANAMSPVINRRSSIMNRLPSNIRNPRIKEANAQVAIYNKNSFCLKRWDDDCTIEIPLQIFKPSLPEKSLVKIQATEKTGKRKLPILQEETTFRIFENPDLVKPVVTMIDDKKLAIEFILPDLAMLESKRNSELNSDNCIPIINKLISTARELILNAVTILQTIFHAMKNDDIRDMNDLYFSDAYRIPMFYTKCVCDVNPWHEDERAIDVRRMFGILSCVISKSLYLSNYIAGKTHLVLDKDDSYKHYLQQMIRYNSWSKKGDKFEMLEIILQFVTLVGLVRRSHQFTGLICAIIELLCNVEDKVGYCQKGIEFVSQIFKELVFSRPLSLCFVPLAKMIMTFAKYTTFLHILHPNPHIMSISNWKGALHFVPQACLLQIFLTQIENFRYDFITTINITYSLISFVQIALHTNILFPTIENSKSCDCCMKLLKYTTKMLCRCSEVCLGKLNIHKDSHESADDLSILKDIKSNLQGNIYQEYKHHIELKKYGIKEYIDKMYSHERTDQNYWIKLKRKQLILMREGIKFLRHLAMCDPDFIIRLSDIEDSFHLFMHNIDNFNELIVQETEREALNFIKSTFIFDKCSQSDVQIYDKKLERLSIATNFKKNHFISNITQSGNNTKTNLSNLFVAYKNLYTNSKASSKYC